MLSQQIMSALMTTIIITTIITSGSEEEKLNSPITGQGQIEVNGELMSYNIQDGLYIVEGDIIVGKVHDRRRLINPITTGPVWSKGYIPYIIDSSLDSTMQSRIKAAITHWQSKTPVRLGLRNGEDDYVRFTSGNGCGSYIGRISGEQDIILANGCDLGAVIHEIGHAVGFHHTHTREDRNSYVNVYLDNVQQKYKHNFDQHNDYFNDCLAYDYGSIMHYGEYFFAIDSSKPTIKPLQNGVTLGNRNGLSNIDIGCANVLYGGTEGSIYKPMISFGGNCLDINDADYKAGINGGKVTTLSCNQGDNQQWHLTSNNEIKSKGGKCLDIHNVDYNSGINGALVQVWDCNGWDNQKFYLNGNQIKSKNGKCLAIHAPELKNDGAKVQSWDCGDSTQQKWSYNERR